MVFDAILAWAGAHPLLFHVTIIILSLVVVIKAADLIVLGITGYAKRLGVSDYLVGSLIIGFGTVLPEFVSSMMGVAASDSGIVLGTILGSSVITVTFVMGVLAIASRRVELESGVMSRVKPFLFPLIMLPYFLVLDGSLGRFDSVLLLGSFVLYVLYLWRAEGALGRLRHARFRHLWRDSFIFLGSLVAMLLAARWLVFSSIVSSKLLGVPSYLLALVVIGIAASIGDLAVELKSIMQKHAHIAFGTVLGSLVIQNCFILGVVSFFFPLIISPVTILIGAFSLALPLFYLLYLSGGVLTRQKGMVLCLAYLLFLLVQLLFSF